MYSTCKSITVTYSVVCNMWDVTNRYKCRHKHRVGYVTKDFNVSRRLLKDMYLKIVSSEGHRKCVFFGFPQEDRCGSTLLNALDASS